MTLVSCFSSGGSSNNTGNTNTGNNSSSNTVKPKVLSVNYASGSTIEDNIEIKIIFDSMMNSTSLNLTGTMSTEAQKKWSQTNIYNDTVVINPTTLWSQGTGKTLSIDCKDNNGIILDTYILTYNISEGVVYVTTGGNDNASGSKNYPKKTIFSAISKAASLYNTGIVKVAEGIYYINLYTEVITMKNGISVYGGYSSTDWSVRDPETYITKIENTNSSPSTLIQFSSLTTDVTLDGFTIKNVLNSFSGTINIDSSSPIISNNNMLNINGGRAVKIINNSSPTIINNTIDVSGDSGKGFELMYLTNSTLKIKGNTILFKGSDSLTTEACYGIDSWFNSTLTDISIEDNIITGGDDIKSSSVGININGSTPAPNLTIKNNTITAGKGINTTGIYLSASSNATITNNTINGGVSTGTGTSDRSCGIYTSSQNSTILIISNNSINGGTASRDSYGIYLYNNFSGEQPSITNNVVDGGSGSNNSFGIVLNGGVNTVSGNRIFGGGVAGTTLLSKGVSDVSQTLLLTNNIINGGNGNEAQGVYVFKGILMPVQKIYNNTIIGGNNSSVLNGLGIAVYKSAPNIENNIIYTPFGSTMKIGIVEFDTSSDPATIKNNNFYGFSTAFLYDEFTTNKTAIVDMEALSANYSGNVNLDPSFEDADGPDNDATTFADNIYKLTSGTPVNIRQGGLDLSATFTGDKDGSSRTTGTSGTPTNANAAGWSMGAYELD